jgi:hypothetical protein
MLRSTTIVALLIATLASTARADVNKFATSGAYLETGATSSQALAIKGKFNTRTDRLRARIACDPGCPLRGRLKARCHVGEGFFYLCEGKIRRKCEVSGTLYQRGFEGIFACRDGTSGAWLFGSP